MSSAVAIYVRVPSDLLEYFDSVARTHGMSRSEAIREAMKIFIRLSYTPKINELKGLVKGSKFSQEDLWRLVLPG